MTSRQEKLDYSKNQEAFDQTLSKRRRRSKGEQDGRKYICQCGKSYLSYPALYTHTKTKHNQILTDKKQESQYIPELPIEQKPYLTYDDVQIISQKHEWKNYQFYIQKFYNLRKGENEYCIGKQPLQFAANQIKRWKMQQTSLTNSAIYYSDLRAGDVIGLFLLQAHEEVSEEYFNWLSVFMLKLRNILIDLQKSQGYELKAMRIPYKLNQIYYKYLSNDYEQQTQYMILVCVCLKLFSQWLLYKQITSFVVKVNVETS